MKTSRYFVAVLLTALMVSPILAVAAAEDDPVKEPMNTEVKPNTKSIDTGSSSAAIDDTTINNNVKKALASNADVSDQKVQVDTKNGVVKVTGKVSDQVHITKIVQVIANVKGVKSVDNQITVGRS